MPPGLQEFLEGVSAWAALLWVGGAAAALGLIVRGIVRSWRKLKLAVALVDALQALPEFMETITEKVNELSEFMERVRHQVENDHDTNLRDEVTQILEMSEATATQVAELSDWQRNHELKSDSAYARISALEQKEA